MPGLRFALDEDVAHRVASRLRGTGHDAHSARELGRLGLSDVQVLLRATDDGRTLVTHNGRDFRALHEAWMTWRGRWEREVAQITGRAVQFSRHAGILVIPHLPIDHLAQILIEVTSITESMENRLLVWNATQGWHESPV